MEVLTFALGDQFMAYLVKLTEELFIEWSGVCDAPCSAAMTADEAFKEFGAEAILKAEANFVVGEHSFNRYGPGEVRLSVEEMVVKADSEGDERNSFDEAFKAERHFKIRKALSASSATLPVAPFAFLEKVFGDKEIEADRGDLDPMIWNKNFGKSALLRPTEAVVAALLILGGISSEAEVRSIVGEFWSSGGDNGTPPDVDVVLNYIDKARAYGALPEAERPKVPMEVRGDAERSLATAVKLIYTMVENLRGKTKPGQNGFASGSVLSPSSQEMVDQTEIQDRAERTFERLDKLATNSPQLSSAQIERVAGQVIANLGYKEPTVSCRNGRRVDSNGRDLGPCLECEETGCD